MNELVEVGTFSGLLFYIGTLLKKAPQVPDWTIPLVLLVLGAVGFMALNGWTVPNAFQGMYSAAGAVLGDQVRKQVFSPKVEVAPKP